MVHTACIEQLEKVRERHLLVNVFTATTRQDLVSISNFKNNSFTKQKQKLRAQYDYQSNSEKALYKDHSSCCFSEFNLYYYLIMLCWLLRKPSTHQFSLSLLPQDVFFKAWGGGDYNKLFNTVASICFSL